MDPFYVAPGASGSKPDSPEGEVKAVSFSPDGLLLAVARSDDELHVYDSRFMGSSREPMKRFLHWGEDHCVGGDRWGIVDAVWVDGWCGRGLGVVTGGSDGEMSPRASPPRLLTFSFRLCAKKGCVRFWDVRRSTDDISNGEVLAQPNSDIGHFSVGEPHKGEKPLVVWVYYCVDECPQTHGSFLAVITVGVSMSMTTRLPVVEYGCQSNAANHRRSPSPMSIGYHIYLAVMRRFECYRACAMHGPEVYGI